MIERTFESVRGARKVILHFYNSTSSLQRDVVFRTEREGIKEIADERRASLVWSCRREAPETEFIFEYSPESFTGTELDFSLEICEAVKDVGEPSRRSG